jgi:hypothetical protein
MDKFIDDCMMFFAFIGLAICMTIWVVGAIQTIKWIGRF